MRRALEARLPVVVAAAPHREVDAVVEGVLARRHHELEKWRDQVPDDYWG